MCRGGYTIEPLSHNPLVQPFLTIKTILASLGFWFQNSLELIYKLSTIKAVVVFAVQPSKTKLLDQITRGSELSLDRR